jgi:hypothetical protein
MTSCIGDGLDDDDYGDYNRDLGGMFGEEVYNNIQWLKKLPQCLHILERLAW